jgi:hypothetical protein
MDVDFGVVPEECEKEMSIKFCNSGAADIPLKLTVQVILNVLPSYIADGVTFFPSFQYRCAPISPDSVSAV